MLEHLKTGDEVELPGRRYGECFHRDFAVFDRETRLLGMQPCDGKGLGSEVDAEHPGATARHALGQEAAATADVGDPTSGETGACVDVIEPGGIEVVQGAELAVRIPPAWRRRVEFRDLGGVDVGAVLHPGSIRAVLKFALSWPPEKTTKSA